MRLIDHAKEREEALRQVGKRVVEEGQDVLRTIPTRWMEVFILRVNGATWKEIAEETGYHRDHVRRVYQAAWKRMFHPSRMRMFSKELQKAIKEAAG